MSLIFVDSFDHQSTAQIQAAGTKWTNGANFSRWSMAAGRTGNALTTTGGSNTIQLYKDFTAAGEIIAGFAYYPTSLTSFSYPGRRFYFQDTATVHLSLDHDADGILKWYRGDRTTLLATADASTALAAASWVYLECYVKIDDTVGRAVCKANGVTILDFTGDTRNGGNATVNRFMIWGDSTSFKIDDLYLIKKGDGVAPDDYIGDVKVECLFPSAAGDLTQFTPTGVANNWDAVNDATHDTDATYVASLTPGNRDLYALTDLVSAAGVVKGVAVNTYMRKDDAGARDGRAGIRSNAVDANGATRALGTTYAHYQDLFGVDPSGSGAWTIARVNALQAGVEVVT